MIDFEQYEDIANLLGISLEKAKTIEGIKARAADDIDLKNGIEAFNANLEVNTVYITLKYNDKNYLNEIQKGLNCYFLNNPHYQRRLKFDSTFSQNSLNAIEEIVNKLDSNYYALLKKDKEKLFINLLDPSTILKTRFEFVQKKIATLNDMEDMKFIDVIQPLTHLDKNKRINFIFWGLIGFLMTNIFLIVIFWNELMNAKEN
jgi:hypothetical protein